MKKLSIGIAHHHDFDGAWFTIQDIKKELMFNDRMDLLDKIEFVIVDNSYNSPHSDMLKRFATESLAPLVYDVYDEEGSAKVKNRIIEKSNSPFVLVLDCHVLLCPVVNTMEKIINFIDENQDTEDLFYGPLVQDRLSVSFPFFKKKWSNGMWGTWQLGMRCRCGSFYFFAENFEVFDSVKQIKHTKCPHCDLSFEDDDLDLENPESYYKFLKKEECEFTCLLNSDRPFEIWAQGTGCFLTKKDSWLGYNKLLQGFGGEEGYIAEKYRKNGRKVYCLPFLKWLHRFEKPSGVYYNTGNTSKARNYVLGLSEIDCPLHETYEHFVQDLELDPLLFQSFVNEARYLLNK
jgi:hypothetical protein